METFWDIVFIRSEEGAEEENTGPIYDFDDARADYLYMIQEHPEDYSHVCLREVTTDWQSQEDIVEIDIWNE